MTIPKITPRYRVLDSTRILGEEKRAVIGGECKRRYKIDYDNTIALWNADESLGWVFNESDVVELTPLEFEGKSIAIGDEISDGWSWFKVYDYCWFDGKWELHAAENRDYENGCNTFKLEDITDLRQQLPKDTKNQKALAKIKELEEKLAELKKEVENEIPKKN